MRNPQDELEADPIQLAGADWMKVCWNRTGAPKHQDHNGAEFG